MPPKTMKERSKQANAKRRVWNTSRSLGLGQI
jgi:hypothetical protein